MSDEKQPQEADNLNDNHSAEEAMPKEEKGINEEIADLAAEAEVTELPTVDAVEEEIEKEEAEAQELTSDSNDEAAAKGKEGKTSVAQKEIEKKDYASMSKEELNEELQRLLKEHEVQLIKSHAEEINTAINLQFDADQAAAKDAFLAEGGNIIDFRYFSPIKKAFNETYFEYRNKRAKYYQNRQKNLKANEELRNQLVEEVKALRSELGGEESVNATYNKFKDIQERWHNAGNIPRDRYNLVWNNYYHHVDSFYELLHLNRDFRDKHYKENLQKKLNLIERAEELTQEPNINKAFKELQLLHRMWKEEVGPVSKRV